MKFNTTLNGLSLNRVVRQAPILTLSQKFRSNLFFNSLSISKSMVPFLKSLSPVRAEFNGATFSRFLDSTISLNSVNYAITGADFTGVQMTIYEPNSQYTLENVDFSRTEDTKTGVLMVTTSTELKITGSRFINNILANANALGVIHLTGIKSLQLDTCTFSGNKVTTSSASGAICLYCLKCTGAINVLGTSFTTTDTSYKPTILFDQCPTITLAESGTTHTKFTSCGGITVKGGTALNIKNTDFDTVQTNQNGGCISLESAGVATMTLDTVTITGAECGTGSKGTAIYGLRSSFSFKDVTISNSPMKKCLVYFENPTSGQFTSFFQGLRFSTISDIASLVSITDFTNGAGLVYYLNTPFTTPSTSTGKGSVEHDVYIHTIEHGDSSLVIPQVYYRFSPQMTSDQCDETYTGTNALGAKVLELQKEQQIKDRSQKRPMIKSSDEEEESKPFYHWVFGM